MMIIDLLAQLEPAQLLAGWETFFKDAINWGIEAGKRALLMSASMYLLMYLFKN